MLGATYRFTALNSLGQTIAISGITIVARRWKLVARVLTQESSQASITSNSGTLANGAYFNGATIDNTTDLYWGGHFLITIVAPSSSSGTVSIYLQRSTDGGTTWSNNGQGVLVKTFAFSASGTQVGGVQI